MKYLVDTNILSELRKGTRCDANVARWAERTATESLFTSVLVLGEIRRGIERLRQNDKAQAAVLTRWLERVRVAFASRTLEVTEQISDSWGRHDFPDQLPVIDGLLAATARVHGLTLVTRNPRDFRATGLAVLDPFKAAL